jgi:hypothetical protein
MILAEVPTVRGIAEKLQIEFKEVEKGTMVVVHAKPVSKLPVGLEDLEGLKIIERFYTYLNESFLLLFPQIPIDEKDKANSLEKSKFDIMNENELDRKIEDKEMQIKEETVEAKNIDDIQIKEVKNDFEKYREIYLRQKGNLPPKQKSSILDGNIDNIGLEKGLEKIGIEKENTENQIGNDDKKEDKENNKNVSQEGKDKLTELESLDKEKSEMKIIDLAEIRKKKG